MTQQALNVTLFLLSTRSQVFWAEEPSTCCNSRTSSQDNHRLDGTSQTFHHPIFHQATSLGDDRGARLPRPPDARMSRLDLFASPNAAGSRGSELLIWGKTGLAVCLLMTPLEAAQQWEGSRTRLTMHNSMAQSNTITCWLDSLPDPPKDYKVRKRRLDELSDATEQKPARRPKMATPNTESEDADHLNTPRPPSIAQLSDRLQVLHPSPSRSSTPSVRSSVACSDTGSSQSRAAKRRRSESPKKRLENLTLARYPVTLHSIGTVRELPSSAQRIARNLRKWQLRVGIIHPDNMDAMQPYLDNDDDLTESLFSDQRGRVGDSPCCTQVVSIVEQANENEAERASEAAWNGDVHTALFRSALRHSPWQHELRCDNV